MLQQMKYQIGFLQVTRNGWERLTRWVNERGRWDHVVECRKEMRLLFVRKWLNAAGESIHWLDDHDKATHAVLADTRGRKTTVPIGEIIDQVPELRKPPGWSDRGELMQQLHRHEIVDIS